MTKKIENVYNFLSAMFYGVEPEFIPALEKAINQLSQKTGIFAADNLFTFGRSLGFISDKPFHDAWQKHARTEAEKAAIWRTSILVWAARSALRGANAIPGDFVECACYKGTSARIVCDALNFNAAGRKYYLYDLFEHDEEMPHHKMREHSEELYAETVARFSDTPNVIVTKGHVPDILHKVAPETISFLHIDLNNADAEMGALKLFFDRVSFGGVIVFDDYGWLSYREQKIAEDAWLKTLGYRILELSTWQGILLK